MLPNKDALPSDQHGRFATIYAVGFDTCDSSCSRFARCEPGLSAGRLDDEVACVLL